MPEVPEYKSEAIDTVKAKLKEEEEKNSKSDNMKKLKEKYSKFGSLPRCNRITVVSEAEHVGEKLPFYNTYVKPGEEEEEEVDEDGKKKKKPKKLFYPDV